RGRASWRLRFSVAVRPTRRQLVVIYSTRTHPLATTPARHAGSSPMIQVRDLLKNYGEVPAVGGISFDVAAGEIFAFLGPNGAGKTTTIQMLTTLVAPTSGTMRIDGLDPMTQASNVRRR